MRENRDPPQSVHPQMADKHRAVADSLEEAGERLFAFTRLPPSQWKSARTTDEMDKMG